MENIDKKQNVMARFKAARQKKRELVAELEKELKARYEERTGQKANYFFSL